MPPERRVRRRLEPVLTALACVALACGGGEEQPAAPAPPSPAGELEELRGALDAERRRSAELEAQLAWTQEQLAVLGSAAAPPEASPDARDAASTPAAGAADDPVARRRERPWFDAPALAERGLPASEVVRLQELFDATQLAEIELQHRATREGWLAKPRYAKARTRLAKQARDDMGEEDYDAILYASGKPNRVVLSDIVSGSPGERAGLLPGDVVVGYAGQRIFRSSELQRAVATGDPGEPVVVDLLRDGEPLSLRIDRGPIGARLKPRRMFPRTR